MQNSETNLLGKLNALTNKVGRAVHDPRLSDEERNELMKAHYALAVAAFEYMLRTSAEEKEAAL